MFASVPRVSPNDTSSPHRLSSPKLIPSLFSSRSVFPSQPRSFCIRVTSHHIPPPFPAKMGSGHSSRFDSSGHTSSRHAAFSLSPFSTLRPHHSSRCGNEHMMYFEPGLDGREMMHDPFEYMDDVVSGRCAGGFPGMWKRPRDWYVGGGCMGPEGVRCLRCC